MLRPLAAAALAVVALASPAGAAMPAVTSRTPVERLASYEPQKTCSPTAKTGVTRFSQSVLKAYAGTGSYGIVRGCSVGGRSEHKEGRAWDWKVSAENAQQRAQAYDLMRWLFATDASGQRAANARRVGLMYLIFDRRIWSAYSGGTGWRAYGGANPHTDHMHLSFSWAGAKATTSWFKVAAPPAPSRVLPTPPRGAAPPAPRPAPKPAFPVAVPDEDDDHEGGWRPPARTSQQDAAARAKAAAAATARAAARAAEAKARQLAWEKARADARAAHQAREEAAAQARAEHQAREEAAALARAEQRAQAEAAAQARAEQRAQAEAAAKAKAEAAAQARADATAEERARRDALLEQLRQQWEQEHAGRRGRG